MYPGPEVWHEAGHAIVARWQGALVRWVTIESDRDDHVGHTEVAWVGFDAEERARRSAMVALGGPIAELLETDLDPEDHDALSSWRGDWEEAEDCLRTLAPRPDERERLRRAMVRAIRAFLSAPDVRERLARVADALDAHETLDETLFDDALG